ncbi:MAG: TRAP transporter small permease [Halofilum sp. (in: g-proteobacteria)]|nr:TRAP transporter small permease [Halofilum sp. (in: g-proteobacteria)]
MATERGPGIARRLRQAEDALLVLAVAALVGLAALQIVLRGVFGGGILWIEPLLRSLVLWSGLLGAVVASRSGQHIAIDVLTRSLPTAWRLRVRAVACAFTALVCAALAWHGGRYVALEYGFDGTAFADVPAWAVVAILPAAFGLIALRYAGFALAFARGRQPFGDLPA